MHFLVNQVLLYSVFLIFLEMVMTFQLATRFNFASRRSLSIYKRYGKFSGLRPVQLQCQTRASSSQLLMDDDELNAIVDEHPDMIQTTSAKFKSIQEENSHFIPEETLYVLDGTSMLHTAYYITANNTRKMKLSAEMTESVSKLIKGFDKHREYFQNSTFDVTGTFAVGKLLIKLVRELNPKYLAVAFDSKKANFRHDLMPEYKIQRTSSPPELLPLFVLGPVVLDALGCPCFEASGYEADDIMATLGRWARERGLNVVHVSVDKDMLQLLSMEGTHIYNPKLMKFMSEEYLESRYGVKSNAFCDYQALVGDKADGIPGVKGIGPKAGSELLKAFGSIEGICQAFAVPETKADVPKRVEITIEDEILLKSKTNISRSKSVLTSLKSTSKEEMLLSRRLVTLDDQAKVPGVTIPAILPERDGFKSFKAEISNESMYYENTSIDNIVASSDGSSESIDSSIDDSDDVPYLHEALSEFRREVMSHHFHRQGELHKLTTPLTTSSSSSSNEASTELWLTSRHLRYTGERKCTESVLSSLGPAHRSLLDDLRLLYTKLHRNL